MQNNRYFFIKLLLTFFLISQFEIIIQQENNLALISYCGILIMLTLDFILDIINHFKDLSTKKVK